MKRESMLTDVTFSKGFKVRGLGIPIYGDPIEEFGDRFNSEVIFDYQLPNPQKPDWTIAQWATRFPFHDINNTTHPNNCHFKKISDGNYQYTNQSKAITVDTNTGTVSMRLLASECYREIRKAGQEWPHLLLERDIGNLKEPEDLTRVSTSKKIEVNIDVRLNEYSDYMNGNADPELHAIIFIYYLFVANFNRETNKFDDMLWFGLPLWDNRRKFTPLQSFPDIGTKSSATDKWIYNNSTKTFFNKDNNLYTSGGEMIFNEWKTVNLDVLPLIKKGFNAARKNGYMLGSDFENLYINGMYFGFEACGTYDSEISVKNLNIFKHY